MALTMESARIEAAAQTAWQADHGAAFDWVATLGLIGAALAAGLFLWVLVRGLSHASRYRATAVLREAERTELASEIARAEERTEGEIMVIVVERSDRHPAAEWVAGSLVLALASVLLAPYLPWNHPAWFFLCQLGLGATGFLAARHVPGFKRSFVSEARADETAHEQALQEFYANGLHRTSDGTGVLIFVSLLERRVVVLGDKGIDAKLDASHWESTDRAILDGVRAGSLKAGLIAGIRRSAEVLAEHFPSQPGARNQLHDHVIVRAE